MTVEVVGPLLASNAAGDRVGEALPVGVCPPLLAEVDQALAGLVRRPVAACRHVRRGGEVLPIWCLGHRKLGLLCQPCCERHVRLHPPGGEEERCDLCHQVVAALYPLAWGCQASGLAVKAGRAPLLVGGPLLVLGNAVCPACFKGLEAAA